MDDGWKCYFNKSFRFIGGLMSVLEDAQKLFTDLGSVIGLGQQVKQDKDEKGAEGAGFMKKWSDVSSMLPAEATAAGTPAPPSAYNAINSRQKLTQLELLMEPRNKIMQTGYDALRNMYYINSIQKTNKLGSHEIYSKSTAASSDRPNIDLGSTKVS